MLIIQNQNFPQNLNGENFICSLYTGGSSEVAALIAFGDLPDYESIPSPNPRRVVFTGQRISANNWSDAKGPKVHAGY